MNILRLLAGSAIFCAAPTLAQEGSELFRYQAGQETRWVSPENPTGAKGAGARENRGAKGHAFETIPVGRSHTLADIKGAGTIDRMWITIEDRSPDARLWDSRTGAPRGLLRGHQGDILHMHLSPDGRRLASASSDRTVRLWDLETHESRVLRGHALRVTGVSFLNDQNLASISWDGTVRLWLDDLPLEPTALRAWLMKGKGVP